MREHSSNAFIRDHCFGLAGAPRNRPDLVGLSFEPARDRRTADITGTIWLDARSYELRHIEFRYTMLPRSLPNADRVGGEVYYARLTSGAWIVSRWFIRMPHEIVLPDDWPRRQLREEGGAVIAEDEVPSTRLATVHGVVRDSAGHPLEGAVVRAIGTHRQMLTGTDGSFRFDSMPPGAVSIVAHTDGYDSFALLAASRRVEVQAGRVHRVDLRAPNEAALRREVCPTSSQMYGTRRVRGVLRLLMVDSATAAPLPGVQFRVSWPFVVQTAAGRDSTTERSRQVVADNRGTATFCDLPTGVPLEVSLMGPGGYKAHVLMTEVTGDGIVGRVVTGRINR
jgi:hypothetical protein